MLSLEELKAAAINPAVAREALTQAESRLADTLDTKKAFEQKATTLFNIYVTLSVALFGVGGKLYSDTAAMANALPFLIVGFIFMCGAALFAWSLMHKDYGALGSTPRMWLLAGTIDGDERVLPLMHAYLAFAYQERIDQSERSNDAKAAQITCGIWLGLSAAAMLLAFALWH